MFLGLGEECGTPDLQSSTYSSSAHICRTFSPIRGFKCSSTINFVGGGPVLRPSFLPIELWNGDVNVVASDAL